MTLSRSRNAQSPRFETLLPHALADEEPVGVARRNPPLIPAGVREPKREVTHVTRNSRPLARLAVNPSSIKLSAVPAHKLKLPSPLVGEGPGVRIRATAPVAPCQPSCSRPIAALPAGPCAALSQHGGLRRPATCDVTIRRTPRLELTLPSPLVGEGRLGIRRRRRSALVRAVPIAALPPSAPPISHRRSDACEMQAHDKGVSPSRAPAQAPLALCGRGAGGEGATPSALVLIPIAALLAVRYAGRMAASAKPNMYYGGQAVVKA